MGSIQQVVGVALCLVLFLNLVSSQLDPFLLASLAMSLIAALGLNLLLHLEQHRDCKPSCAATLYLLASVLCDLVALAMPSTALHRPPPARCLLYAVLLALGCFMPRPNTPGIPRSEDESGIFGRLFFTWINPVLLRGYKSRLSSRDLPQLGAGLSAKLSRDSLLGAWNRRGWFCFPICVSYQQLQTDTPLS